MAILKTNNLYDSNGQQIHLGKKLGSGGEGDVYELEKTPSENVAKIYHEPLEADKQAKLKTMTKCHNENLRKLTAWPLDLVLSGNGGPICGFVMPRIIGYEPIHKLYGPVHRKQLFSNADWAFLINSARNMAAAFDAVHSCGHVIGDVNQGNIVVSKNSIIKLIDCDSFQISAENKYYLCEVGVPHFTPPEMQSFRGIQRTSNHDYFGLAILCFHLLFMGRHPFAGRYLEKGDMPIEKAIKEYRFAFSSQRDKTKMSPPPNCPEMNIVSDEIAKLFEKAFSEGGAKVNGRPMAKEWITALDGLKNNLRTCSYISIHKYYGGLGKCPWCALESQSSVVFFVEIFKDNIDVEKFEINAIWLRIMRVQPPGIAPEINTAGFVPTPKPLDSKYKDRQSIVALKKIISIGLAIVGVVFFFSQFANTGNSGGTGCLGSIIFFIIAAVLGFSSVDYSEEYIPRKKSLEEAEKRKIDLENRWNAEASEKCFIEQLEKLKGLKSEYENLDAQFGKEKTKLANEVKKRQLFRFMEGFSIDESNIPQIGPARTATLASYGIETAADINARKISSIPGFGDYLTGILVSWARNLESKFVYDPKIGIDPADLNMLRQKFTQRKAQLEGTLLAGPEQLERVCVEIKKSRQNLYSSLCSSVKEVAQAKADISIIP